MTISSITPNSLIRPLFNPRPRKAVALILSCLLVASCGDMKDLKSQMDEAINGQQAWSFTDRNGVNHLLYAHRTTYDEVIAWGGPSDVTAVRPASTPAGGRIITYRSYNMQKLGSPTGIGLNDFLWRNHDISDFVLTFDPQNLLTKTETLDMSSNAIAEQEVLAGIRQAQTAAPVPVTSAPVKPLSEIEMLEFKDLILWRKAKQICGWALPDKRMAHLNGRIDELGNRINRIDREMVTNHQEFAAQAASTAACISDGDKADFYKTMTRYKI